ncbi:MAG: imidazolonepropionase [Saprospiraceae bacterium]|nr:imidazolonepropionase [Saprospiraceae bacterium]
MPSILVKNIGTLCGINEKFGGLKKGGEMARVDQLNQAFLLCENGQIIAYGGMDGCPDRADNVVDAANGHVLPGWCDSHTHLVFAASREEEFVYRLKGMSYAEIAEKGGGILNSATKLQAMDEDLLYEQSAQRLEKVISMGTAAIEIKSGYGLTFDSELKMLRVIRRLKENYAVGIKATFLGAHAVPAAYKENRQGYIEHIIRDMLPIIAGEGLADYMDVFCDKGFYTIEETDLLLKTAAGFGLKPKIHANELANSGGVQIGIKNNAISVDHLEEIGSDEIEALRQSRTIPTVLPSCSYFLGIPYAPARKMIDAGLGIAIASDYNPGTSPSGNLSLLMSLACTQMKLLPEEAFNGLTHNGACAMEWQQQYGSIGLGKTASFIITHKIPSLAFIPYSFGENLIKQVVIKGRMVS